MESTDKIRELEMGIYDAPLKQKQDTLRIDLLKSNLAVFGSKQSGKTVFIKNLFIRLHEKIDPKILAEEIYILDLNSTMGDYDKLPCICACFDDSNEEDVKTLFETVKDKLKRNNDILKLSKRNSIRQFIDDPPELIEERPKHITLVIENLNAFISEERFSLYHELLLKFCRDGISKGLTVVFTANSVSGGVGRFLANMETAVAFDLPVDQATEIFNEKPPQHLSVPGRGIVRIESELYEFQAFLPFESEKNELAPFISNVTERIGKQNIPTRLKSFTKQLTQENFAMNTYSDLSYEKASQGTEGIIFGLDYYSHSPVSIIPEESRCIAIYGKKGYGKTNLLNHLVGRMFLRETTPPITRIVTFDDGRKELDGLIKYINETLTDIKVICFDNREAFSSFVSKEDERLTSGEETPAQAGLPGNNPPALPEAHRESQTGSFFDSPHTDMSENMTNDFVGDLEQYDNAYIQTVHEKYEQTEQAVPEETPYLAEEGTTLFILQSKSLYQNSKNRAKDVMFESLFSLINDADRNNMIFIFSDVKRHPDADVELTLNSVFSKAFLLNDIAEFVGDRGGRSVFGDLDQRELKLKFAKCEVGDGYYYDIDRDELTKVKFMRSPFNIRENKNSF